MSVDSSLVGDFAAYDARTLFHPRPGDLARHPEIALFSAISTLWGRWLQLEDAIARRGIDALERACREATRSVRDAERAIESGGADRLIAAMGRAASVELDVLLTEAHRLIMRASIRWQLGRETALVAADFRDVHVRITRARDQLESVLRRPVRIEEPISRAYRAAESLVEHLGELATRARAFNPGAPPYRPGTAGHMLGHNEIIRKEAWAVLPADWKDWGGSFAEAFVAQAELGQCLTRDVRLQARRVHPLDSPPISITGLEAKPSVLEIVADQLGPMVRGVLTSDNRHPLELGRGRALADLRVLVEYEWESMKPTRAEAVAHLLRCGSIDFDDLAARLDREALAVTEANRPMSQLTGDRLLERFAALQPDGGTASVEKAKSLSKPKPWAMEAWRAHQMGMTMYQIATELSEKYGDKYGKISQPRVSEQISKARAHAEASGLAELASQVLPKPDAEPPARTLDPMVVEQGRRTDGRSPHLRAKARQIADEE